MNLIEKIFLIHQEKSGFLDVKSFLRALTDSGKFSISFKVGVALRRFGP